jgi:ABC-type phosphonate transport system ATPase subunit
MNENQNTYMLKSKIRNMLHVSCFIYYAFSSSKSENKRAEQVWPGELEGVVGTSGSGYCDGKGVGG